jgi:anaerobic dimethyl sulfoxide reductase subunit A
MRCHDVGLPWYKGHYYIHRPKVIEPMGESRTDFQVYTELAYRLEKLEPQDFGKRYNPRADRSYFQNPDATDGLVEKVQQHQGVTMSWDEFKRRGVYKFTFDKPYSASRSKRVFHSKRHPGRSRFFRPRWLD